MRNTLRKESSYHFRELPANDRGWGGRVARNVVLYRWELGLMAMLAVIALIPRLLFLVESDFGVESDEAIVGLMAKHIAEGGAIPVFYYGQHYMGSLEAVLASFLFRIFGESSHNLKLVPLIFSAFHVALVYAFARRFVGWQAAVIAGLLTALGPGTLLQWSIKARGGFIELVAIGTLALILAVDCLQGRENKGRVFSLGLLLGLGWWVNNQIVFYLVPIATLFAIYFPLRRGVIESVGFAALLLFGFFLGGAPFWYANIFTEPRFATFEVLFGSSAGGNFFSYLSGFFTTALPILLGARRSWSSQDSIPAASLVLGGLYALLFVAFLFLPARSRRAGIGYAQGLLLAFVVSLALIFSASSFGWLARAPRYLLPLYSVLFVIVAIAIEKLWHGRMRLISCAAVVLLVAANWVSAFWGGMAIEGQPIVYRGQRVADSHQGLYSWLAEQGYSHIHTNYWIGYRVAFETRERITFTRYGNPRSLRIPEYERRAKQLSLPEVFVLVPAEAAPLEQELQRFGYTYRRSELSQYVVLDRLTPRWPRGERLVIAPEAIQVFNRAEQRVNLVDGSEDTRWGSGMPQHPGMELSVTLAEPTLVTSLRLVFGPFVHDAPRDLEVLGVTKEGTEVSLFRLAGTKTYYELQQQSTSEVDPEWNIYFPPQTLTKMILRQHGTTQVFDWSIAELELYQPRQQQVLYFTPAPLLRDWNWVPASVTLEAIS